MGNAQLYVQKYDIVRLYKHNDWLPISTNQHYQLCRHKFTHQTAQLYQLHDVPSIEDMNIYDFRSKQQLLVKVYFIGFEHQNGICGNNHTVEILVEHITYKFEQLVHLTQQQALSLFLSALKGFKVLQHNFGPVEPSEQLMGVNTEGKLKVWLNSNPTKNSVDKHRIQSISDKFSSASIRVRKLYRLVEQKCIDIFLPYYIKQKFCNRHIAYTDAINLVHQYAINNKINLNKYLPPPDLIKQKLKYYKVSRRDSFVINKQENQKLQLNKQIIFFANSFVSPHTPQLSGKTLKKTVSLIHMDRPQSSLNKKDSTNLLNQSRLVFNNPQLNWKRPTQHFTEIRFIHQNIPTKIFYSPNINPKLNSAQSIAIMLQPFQSQASSLREVGGQVKKQQQKQLSQKQLYQKKVQQTKLQQIEHKGLQLQVENKQEKDFIDQAVNQKQQSDIMIMSEEEPVEKQILAYQLHKTEVFLMNNQEMNKQNWSNEDRHKQLFTTFGNQKQSELFKFRQKQLINLKQHTVYQKQHVQDIQQALISPSFNSVQLLDKKQHSLPDILPQVQSNSSRQQSLQSFDSKDFDSKRKRTSIFAAVEIDYARNGGGQGRVDKVKQVQEQTSKQLIFGSFSKIGSFNIVRIDSLLEKKYEQSILKQDKQTKFNKTHRKDQKSLTQQPEQDFLNVEYLQKSLDKRYSPYLSKRAVQKQPQEDDVLDIEKLEEKLVKFSKFQPNHNQLHQVQEYTINIKKPEELQIEKINLQHGNPSNIQASNSIRVAESDSCRADNCEISDTSINIAIVSNKQKEREESLKRTSSSSRFHFYDNYARKNSNYDHYNRYFDTSFTKQSIKRKQPSHFNSWQFNSDYQKKKVMDFHTNSNDYDFEEKYKRHIKLRNQQSRPTTSYQPNYAQQTQYQRYGANNQQKESVQRQQKQKQVNELNSKQVKQWRNDGEGKRRLTYQQLREILWN